MKYEHQGCTASMSWSFTLLVMLTLASDWAELSMKHMANITFAFPNSLVINIVQVGQARVLACERQQSTSYMPASLGPHWGASEAASL